MKSFASIVLSIFTRAIIKTFQQFRLQVVEQNHEFPHSPIPTHKT